MDQIVFEEFPKIARLSRECVITEKIDGTNASIIIADDGQVVAASRTRIITPQDDNFGFARWVEDNKDALRETLGIGRHFGEWWGSGIQRRYGLSEKRFSLFNTYRWGELITTETTSLVHVVPILHDGPFSTETVDRVLDALRVNGSVAAPGFDNPEGVVIFHKAAQVMFKKTIEKDEEYKGKSAS